MPVFSFTAPHITPEEEQQERDSLAEELKTELQHDLYGVDNAMKETPDLVEQGLKEMERILREEVSEMRKKDYLQAQNRIPDLVEKECNPLKFLRCEKYKAERAVDRMITYWKIRRKLFGDEKSFLPLTLTGALLDDLEVVESGIFALHPKDDCGRGVLFFDRIRAIPPLAPRDAVLRVLFYIIHIMSEDESMQAHGYVCLTNIKGYDLYTHFDRLLTKYISVLMIECMPIKMKAEHLLAGSANGVMSLVLPVMKYVVAKELRLRIVVHSGTESKVLASITPYGLSGKNVSHVLGGDVEHTDFEEWLEEWREVEQGKYE